MPEVAGNAAAAPQVTVGVAKVPSATAPPDIVSAALAALGSHGLVVVAGPPGCGRTTTLHRLGQVFGGPAHAGGALAMLRSVPALALSRALRVRLPADDPALLAEAVRSRLRGDLLLLDDLQWADQQTIAALPALARHSRVVAALRSPHRLPAAAERALRRAAALWLTIPPLTSTEAEALARAAAPTLTGAAVAAVIRRAGGSPLAVRALARASAAGTPAPTHPDLDHALAAALADLTRPGRTALAALGLLGRPAAPAILGPGLTDLVDAGLATITTGDGAELAAATSPYTAEVAAGLLDPTERQAMHRRLADLVPAAQAARHLAAAGDYQRAFDTAVDAARSAPAPDRADLLRLACELPQVTVPPQVRQTAARAALTAGRPASCRRLVADQPDHPVAAVLLAEAHLQLGDPGRALSALAAVPDDQPQPVLADRDRVRLLALLAADPTDAAGPTLAEVLARHGDPPGPPGLRAAVAAVAAATRTPGWEGALANAAAAAAAAGEVIAARWSAWLLVETLTDDGRLAQANAAATAAAEACGADLAYSWQTRFVAAALWADALRSADPDTVTRRGADLVDRTVPADALRYALAAVSLTEADAGLLSTARARLGGAPPPGHGRAAPIAALDWVAAEAAWLDGQPDAAAGSDPGHPHDRTTLVDGLRTITARWAAFDTDRPTPDDTQSSDLTCVRQTLEAWAAPERFPQAAASWHDLAPREEIRCLLAHGLLTRSAAAATAVPGLLTAERLAEQAGLVVLLGRVRRALRRHAVRRDSRGPRAGDHLTERERQILHLVARGEPTRRISGQLGLSRETVETHIRAAMRKLGARTRTEAAAIAAGAGTGTG